MQKKLLFEKQKHIATLTLNRPEVHNAFDDELIALFIATLNSIQNDNEIRVVVLKSEGKNFSAGADLQWMQKMLHYSETENKHDSLLLAELMHKLYSLNKPTIAQIQGAALGGALGLIACCDIAIASSSSTFCLSEVKIGLIPAVISPYIINAIGLKQARRYALTAEVFDAITAKALGLINTVVEIEDLSKTTATIILSILKNSPKAVAATKCLLQYVHEHPLNTELINYTAEQIAAIRVSNEGQEGLSAFLEKRQPNWIEDDH